MASKKKRLVHLLITLDLFPAPIRMHSYVICSEKNERQIMEGVGNRMMEEVEKQGGSIQLPIILSTKLDTGADVVQSILDEYYPEARRHFDNVKDFHLTMWMMGTDVPADKKLMELH